MTRFTVRHEDITCQQVDVIVNAANQHLAGGGGVDGAIHRAAGPRLREACLELRRRLGNVPCPTGQAVVTEAGELPARYVVHTAGPVWNGGQQGEAELLRSCYVQSLQRALEVGARTLAFPCISAGIFGYPAAAAAAVAVAAVRGFEGLEQLEEIRFVVFSEKEREIYEKLLASG